MSRPEPWRSAPAKVNLGLAVRGRRGDGFHELDGVMALIDLADSLALAEAAASPAPDRLERVPAGDGWLDRIAIPLDDGNLILQAARLYREAARERGVELPALTWRLIKRVPIAAGLGGGSSDAAAALRLLDQRYPAGLDLLALAQRLGSDVPFFVLGVAAARARGRGERLDPVRVPAQPLVLVNPGVGVRAADAFRWWDGRRPAAVAGAAAAWWSGPDVTNELEPGVAAHVPEVRAVLDMLRAAWDGPVAMSGSGATCFALAPDVRAAQALADELRRRLAPSAWVALSTISERG